MGCETCGDKKPACDKGFTKAALEIKNPSQLVEFRKIVVPASLGDDTAVPPVIGKYCNAILYYEANDQVYLYSSDGIPTKITVDVEAFKKQIKDLQEGLASEANTRSAADLEIWQEIEAIEASSDVVDVVGTYAELQQYDTSKLHNNDLIKVLQDETHGDAITYYRWNDTTDTFFYVGAEGPYYTASETDTLLAAKQDTLIAGANIQIAADGKTISATDTTYTHFTGATASVDGAQGLVPGPLAGDQNKVLKGDGTWGDAGAIYSAGNGINIDANDEISVDTSVIQEKLTAGANIQINNGTISATDTTYSNFTGATASTAGTRGLVPAPAAGDQGKCLMGDGTWGEPGAIYTAGNGINIDANDEISVDTTVVATQTDLAGKQDILTAGSNISISNNTISATDTTYTAGDGIDIDAQNVISADPNNINSTDWNALWQ